MGVHLLRKQHSSAAASGGGSTGSGTMPPKGCMAVRVVGPVGGGAAEEEERFVVPVGYLKHPLFVGLLKEAEEEYGFQQQGAITIPCGVENFRRVQSLIDHRQKTGGGGSSRGLVSGGHHHHNHGSSSGHLPFHIAACFRA
ncbi:auxin-responsive protein SAUR32-like [Lolium rigidum]|uniref:auxin-responsive protein SAUR32-like n=1 Tax=Lolium rigidum TaxID=89674 RepID=UPI001F5DE758|nr:auxin-responsive protein SAUR32-like [Lolium rigidum]